MARMRPTQGEARSIRVVMDVLLVLAVLMFFRLVIGFFGVLAASPTGAWYLTITRGLVPSVAGGWVVRSPYGGVFSVDAAIVIVVLLAIEWLLAARSASPANGPAGKDHGLERHRA